MRPNPFLQAGVDEAGRGPLAGPVVVAAVILPAHYDLRTLDDSKRLSARSRELLVPQIENQAIAFAVEFVDVEEIDLVNILYATLNGMQRAVENLNPSPHMALIDGNRAPHLSCEVQTVIGGDRLVASISAASVLAKVYRDRLMLSMHDLYPDYGFDQHKGYPTAHTPRTSQGNRTLPHTPEIIRASAQGHRGRVQFLTCFYGLDTTKIAQIYSGGRWRGYSQYQDSLKHFHVALVTRLLSRTVLVGYTRPSFSRTVVHLSETIVVKASV